jgi:transcriptional regulator with XRE-family HTH domain
MIRNEQERQRIGQDIAQLRKEKRMTQQDLADRVEMQRAHIARIEAGRYSVGLDTLTAIGQALGKRLVFV